MSISIFLNSITKQLAQPATTSSATILQILNIFLHFCLLKITKTYGKRLYNKQMLIQDDFKAASTATKTTKAANNNNNTESFSQNNIDLQKLQKHQ